jgi:hypothetical protein
VQRIGYVKRNSTMRELKNIREWDIPDNRVFAINVGFAPLQQALLDRIRAVTLMRRK